MSVALPLPSDSLPALQIDSVRLYRTTSRGSQRDMDLTRFGCHGLPWGRRTSGGRAVFLSLAWVTMRPCGFFPVHSAAVEPPAGSRALQKL